MKYILASASERRQELLKRIVDDFDIIISNFDEDAIKFNGNVEEYVIKIAEGKALDVLSRVSEDSIIIAADTIVVNGDKILGKPKSEEDACNMLKELQNNVNYVYSGLAVITKKDGRVIEKNDYTKTAVYIKKMTEKEIKEYVKTGEPLDKAGSYAIQGIGGKFIDKIEGSYNNVVGMDTEKLAKYLGED